MSSGKKQSTETPTKRIFSKFLSRKKKEKDKEKDGGKRQSTEGINKQKDDDDAAAAAAGMRTCEEVVEGGANSTSPGSPMSIKQKRKKKKKDGKDGGTVDEDETVKGRKSKDKEKDKDKDELKTAKKKKSSKGGKREKTEDAAPQPSGMATVFEKIQAPSRPAIAHNKEINDHIKEDIERIDKEEKKEKEKEERKEKEKQQQQAQQAIDEFAPTVFEPIQAQAHPIITSMKVKKHPRQAHSPDPVDVTAREKPLYASIPKENAITACERKDSGSHQNKKMSAESTTTGRERSNKAAKHSDSQDDADCKTAMIPASAVKVGQYQMVMYKGVPRYEPVNQSTRPYEKSEKEVAAKIEILQPPPSLTPTSPTFPGDHHHNNNNVPKTPPKSPSAASPGKNGSGAIVIGTLPKNQQSSEDPKKDGVSPVSQYVAPLDR